MLGVYSVNGSLGLSAVVPGESGTSVYGLLHSWHLKGWPEWSEFCRNQSSAVVRSQANCNGRLAI